MLEIKTILKTTAEYEKFDEEVNEALRAGWALVKRDVLSPYEGDTGVWHQMLIAELEREVMS